MRSGYLSKREQQIMEIVHQRGEVSATDVELALSDRPSNATVRSLMRTLEGKGELVHREEGNKFIYTAAAPRQAEGESALRRVLGTFFDGSLSAAVSTLVSGKVSVEELDELERMIAKAREAQS